MSRKNPKYSRNTPYMRPTEGYQRNIARGKMKELNVPNPKNTNIPKVIKASKILFFVWLPAAIASAWFFGFIGLVFAGLIAIMYVFVVYKYIESFQQKLVGAYMDMDIPKEVYVREMKKRNPNAKAIARLTKVWDKVEKKRRKKESKQRKES